MPPRPGDLFWLPAPPADFRARCRALSPETPELGAALQHLATHALEPTQAVMLGRALARCDDANLAPLARFRLGILAAATVTPIADALPAAALRHGVALELHVAPYGQILQQALDPSSAMRAAKPDAVLVLADHRWLELDHGGAEGSAARALEQLVTTVNGLREGGIPSILQTVPVPPFALYGNHERRVAGSLRNAITALNQGIVELAATQGAQLLDLAALAEQVGTAAWFEPAHWNHHKLPVAAEFIDLLADHVGRLLGAIRGKARKCLVLDLDNTCWGGVIGDDGLANIRIGQGDALGEAFLSVQRTALDLRQRGIMLAVASKNDDATARLPFRDHPDMLLRERHIVVFQANWQDKASNLEAIARTLNIGVDALVFLDDNPMERAHLRAALPMVAVPELPKDPAWYGATLLAAGYFETIGVSDEDRLRVDSYAADATRAEVLATARNLDDYLMQLEMVISFAPFDAQGRVRISQLINKTNQFNLTTRRRSEAEVAALEADAASFTLQVRLRDRYGDLGMIGVLICQQRDAESWDIDTWLMSCRVLGRGVEAAMLDELVRAARERGIARLFGSYLRTAKNGMVADHYSKLGFAAGATENAFVLDLAAYQPANGPHMVERAASGATNP